MKKRLLSMLLMAVTATGAWAIDTDTDGYYLIGTVQDWQDFATLVQTTPTANARMTADINLGDDQTMVGSNASRYAGTFDGQGHTLTVNYNTSTLSNDAEQSYLGAAPFRDIEGATIRNLHTAGTITIDKIGATGLVGWSYGSSLIEYCWSEVNIISSTNSADTFSGFVFRQDGTDIVIRDCIYSGKIQSASRLSHAGFIGHHYAGTATLTNCFLNLADGSDTQANNYFGNRFYTFVRSLSDNMASTYQDATLTNCYYKTAFGTAQGTQATTEELADGTTATALQAGRAETVWVQDPVMNQPMLKLFANVPSLTQDADGYYLIGTVDDYKLFAALVNEGDEPTANARMTADITLSDNTMVGTEAMPYQGTFDGQGHTLTVNYDRTGLPYSTSMETGAAPFLNISTATIRNLHVTGTIRTSTKFVGGVVGNIINQNNLIECCRSSVDITSYVSYQEGCIGGIVSHMGNTNAKRDFIIRDCVFDGSIDAPTAKGNGGIMGYKHGDGSLVNCLFMPTAVSSGSDSYTIVRHAAFALTLTNCHYSQQLDTAQGTLATADDLADGTTAAALQGDREETIWVQDPLTNQPMLKLFAGKYIMPSSGLGTFSAKAKLTLPEGLEAYYCKGYDASAGTIAVAAIDGVVPAETGVLLKGTAGETYTISASSATPDAITDNALVAVTDGATIQQTADINEVNYTNFGLSGGVFKKVNSNGGTVGANRAYLHILTSALTSEALARGISLVWDEDATMIEDLTIDGKRNADSCYDLQGRRVENPTKGLYIVNGKKVIIK